MNEKQRTTSTESHTLTAAKVLLFEAGKQNPGPWIRHSEFVAEAAGKIASQCPDLDVEQAVICGLLHDIGRRYGVTYLAHVYDGYRYLMELGWERAARVALSHSFNLRRKIILASLIWKTRIRRCWRSCLGTWNMMSMII